MQLYVPYKKEMLRDVPLGHFIIVHVIKFTDHLVYMDMTVCVNRTSLGST